MTADAAISDAALRDLLADSLKLWGVAGRVSSEDEGMVLTTADGGKFLINRAHDRIREIRWTLVTPARQAAGRPPRPASSIVGLLSALRAALGAEHGPRARGG